jgi:hypothetical protein
MKHHEWIILGPIKKNIIEFSIKGAKAAGTSREQINDPFLIAAASYLE